MAGATYFGKNGHNGSLLFFTVPTGLYRFEGRPNGTSSGSAPLKRHLIMRPAHSEFGHAKTTPHRFKRRGNSVFPLPKNEGKKLAQKWNKVKRNG